MADSYSGEFTSVGAHRLGPSAQYPMRPTRCLCLTLPMASTSTLNSFSAWPPKTNHHLNQQACRLVKLSSSEHKLLSTVHFISPDYCCFYGNLSGTHVHAFDSLPLKANASSMFIALTILVWYIYAYEVELKGKDGRRFAFPLLYLFWT